MFGFAFVKAQPTTCLLQYKGGRVVREGAGLSFFYYRAFSTVAAVPVGSRDVPFIFELVTHDFQAVTVQGQVAFRVAEPRKAAGMLDFALKPDGKGYMSEDPQRLPERIMAISEVLLQQAVKGLSLKDALRASPDIDAAEAFFAANGAAPVQSGAWGEKGKPGSGRFAYSTTDVFGGVTTEFLWNLR